MKVFPKYSRDWCHLCGLRLYGTLEISYSKNAEHDKGNESQFIRMCGDCIESINHIADTELTLELITKEIRK